MVIASSASTIYEQTIDVAYSSTCPCSAELSKKILHDDGIFMLEQADLLSIIKFKMFDTICHEHLQYYSLTSVKYILDQAGLKIVDIDGGQRAFNMHDHNLFDILDKDLFRKLIPDTWDNESGNTSMRPAKCGQCCGVEWNGLDFGELGDKQNSYLNGGGDGTK